MSWSNAALGLVLLLSVASLATNLNTMNLLDEATQVQEHTIEMAQTLTTTWTDADGLDHTVSTPREEGEDATQHAQRHAESVEALKEIYPPAP